MSITGFSAWDATIGAGMQTFLPVSLEGRAGKRHLKAEAREILELLTAARGYVLEQDMVVFHTPIFDDAKIRHNGVHLATSRALTGDELQTLYSALHEKFSTWDLAPGWRPDGARLINFVEGLDNKAFLKGFDEVIRSMPEGFGGGTLRVKSFRSEGGNVSNDWEKNPNGEDHLRRLQTGRSDIQRIRDLRSRVQTVNQEFAQRYGWDKPGRRQQQGTATAAAGVG